MKFLESAPGVVNVKLLVRTGLAPPTDICARIEKKWRKSVKWTKNDQFRQFHFLNQAHFDSNYTSNDAELQVEFFETISIVVAGSVVELLKKNVSRTGRRNFIEPMASENGIFTTDSEFDQICRECCLWSAESFDQIW